MATSIEERGDGSYSFRLWVTDKDGKRKQQRFTIKAKNKTLARKELVRIQNEINQGSYVDTNNLTVDGFLRKWLADYVKPNRTAKTYERYEELLRLHVAPAFGTLPLEKLKPLHVQGLYTEKQKTLSARTVLHIHRVLHTAFEQGVRWQLLVRNVTDAVDPPRPSRTKMTSLDSDQVARLLELANGRSIYPAVVLSPMTGMRLGEICALKWEDIDLEKGLAVIDESLEETKEHGLRFKSPKNGKASTVVLPPLAVEFLRRHKGEQAQQRLLMGLAYQDQGLVFPQADGSPRNPDAVSRQFTRFIRTTDLPHIRFHDLRHTCASLMIDDETNVKVIQEQLRHSSISTTMDTYGHLLPGMQSAAMNRLDARIRKAMGQ